MSSRPRRYIAEVKTNLGPLKLWVNEDWAFEAKCDRCADTTIVSFIFSHMDGKFLVLCDFDVMEYVYQGFITFSKEGQIYIKDPNEPKKPFWKKRHWQTRTYCSKCGKVTLFTGVSKPIDKDLPKWKSDNFIFEGNCIECGGWISDQLQYLLILKDQYANENNQNASEQLPVKLDESD